MGNVLKGLKSAGIIDRRMATAVPLPPALLALVDGTFPRGPTTQETMSIYKSD
jgi:hypothetical protein